MGHSDFYPTQAGDVWSLGVILVNLASGRNPWRQATLADEAFYGYMQDPDFLRKILPISTACNHILQRIFTIDPAQRISLAELRQLVVECESFTMDETELKKAHAAAQIAIYQAAPAPTPINLDDCYPLPTGMVDGDYSPALSAGSSEASFDHQPVFSFDGCQAPSFSSDSDLSRSSSSGGCLSIPPTPIFAPNDGRLQLPVLSDQIWDLSSKGEFRRTAELRIQGAASPDYLSSGTPNPFFR